MLLESSVEPAVAVGPAFHRPDRVRIAPGLVFSSLFFCAIRYGSFRSREPRGWLLHTYTTGAHDIVGEIRRLEEAGR